MSRWYFVPPEWEMSETLLAWTKKKGLTDKTIEDELESFKDHQYKRPMMKPDACWRNWVKNGIRWGNITPIVEHKYKTIPELSTSERERDSIKAIAQMDEYRNRK